MCHLQGLWALSAGRAPSRPKGSWPGTFGVVTTSASTGRHSHPDRLIRPSRRDLLVGATGLAATAGLAACSSSGEVTIPAAAEPGRALLAAFPRSVPHVPVGIPTRLPYLISDEEGVPFSELTGDVGFTISMGGTEVASATVAPRSEGIPRAYLPLEIEFPEAGVYDIVGTYEGQPLESRVEVFEPDEVAAPVVGQQLPPALTPTVDNPGLVDPICTLVPECSFHGVNLQDVTTSGQRIVLLVATPAYCQTAFCGPTLGNLIDLASDREDLVVIHSEVYQKPKVNEADLQNAPLAPVPEAYSLAIEPVLYVTDEQNTITARADAIVDRSEMAELIA